MKKNDKKFNEDFNQILIISMLKKLQMMDDKIMFFSVPNGGYRNKAEAAKLKMTGLLPGVPDLVVMGKNKIHFIELKKGKGILLKEQKYFILKSSDFGFDVSVIYGDTPHEVLPQVGKIMHEVFGYQQKGISSIVENILSSSIAGNTGSKKS